VVGHVWLNQASVCLLDREQAAVEAVGNHLDEVIGFDLRRKVDDRAQRRRAADAFDRRDVGRGLGVDAVHDHGHSADERHLGRRAVAIDPVRS